MLALGEELDGATFPSPCGEKVGINDWEAVRILAADYRVSVPLRGKGRDQRFGARDLVGVVFNDQFPSPCGEKVGINYELRAPSN